MTEKEISNIIISLNAGKATGPNSVSNFILKESKGELKKPLTIINNMSFITGKFPTKGREAHIIPSYKKGDKSECSNCRPISLLPNSKITEKAMHSRIYNFLEKSNCLYKKKFGFRNSHSTNHALISVTEKIRESLDNNPVGYSWTFKKHSILLITTYYLKSYITMKLEGLQMNGVRVI